jgi:putative polyketide hydroxylase
MSGEFRRDDAYDCDVLVVGGGLVGLVASMFLAQQGLRVWVVERHVATSSHPKLRGVSARTMELYMSAGIEDAIRPAEA